MRQTPRSSDFWLLCFVLCAASAPLQADTLRVLPASSVQASLAAPESPAYLELNPQDWEGRSLSLADILAMQAGIQTRRTGGMGSRQTVSIRGMGANQVVICIDGIPLSASHGAGVDLASLDWSQFARIEVYKGQVPARFGGNGMGGVVNLVSHQAVSATTRLQGSYGSHGSQELSLRVARPWSDSIHLASTLSQRGATNDFEFTDRNGTEYNTQDDQKKRRQNAEFWQMGGLHSLRILHATGRVSQLWVQHSQFEGGIPGQESHQTVTAGTEQQEVRARYQLEEAPYRPWHHRGEVFVHSTRSSMHWYYPLDKIGLAVDDAMESGVLSQGGGVRLATEYRISGGIQPVVELFAEGSGTRMASRDQSSRFTLRPWELGHSQGQLGTHLGLTPMPWLDVETEGQYRLVRDHFSGGSMNSTLFDQQPSSDTYRHLGSAHVALQAGPPKASWRLFVSGGRYFRAPEPMEIYGVGGGLLPNPDLVAETGYQWESGWSWQQRMARMRVGYFFNQAQDRIVWVTSGSLSRPSNLGQTTNYGVEAQVSGSPFSWLDWQANATWQNPRDESGHSSYQGKVLPDEPLQAYGARAVLHLGKMWDVQWDGEARSRLYRDRSNQERIPPQSIHHLSIRLKPWEGGQWRLSAQNLGHAVYQNIYSAYPAPGRQYFVSFTQDF